MLSEARLGYHLQGVCGARAPQAAAELWPPLQRAYSEPQRHYHTLEHLGECLAWLDWCWGLAQRPHELALMLWFHDAVYDPARTDNEARSAQLSRSGLARYGVDEAAMARIESGILATAGHGHADGDLSLLLDIDLAILGASATRFAAFEAQVREEYRALAERTYAAGRLRVLTALRARSPLYTTPLLHDLLEHRAQHNLHQAIERWQRLAQGG